MAGRNNKPDNDGPAGHPGRLDQFGDALASRNEEEFEVAAEQACETDAADSKAARGEERGGAPLL